MYVPTFSFGKLPVEMWEYTAFALLLLIVFLVSGRIKSAGINTRPEYRFFLWGMWAKIGGGVFFAIVYTSYYEGGDTTSYYECSLAFYNLLFHDGSDFLTAFLGPGNPEIKSLFTTDTGSPMAYMFFDDKTRTVVKLVVPFLLLGFGSFFLTTVFVAIFTYGGLWRLYLMFTSYFPQYSRELAISVLFMPSVIFWGSGILKDSFTLAATCYFIGATNDLITRKGKPILNWIILIISGLIIINIKPYILIILLPGTLVWYFYDKIKRIRNSFFRYIIVPFVYIIIAAGSYLILTGLGDKLGKFSPEKALETAVVTSNDLKQEYYEGNSFDIGTFEATPLSIASKFPAATVAGLFRPFLWEARNVVMLLSAVENTYILASTLLLLVLIRRKVLVAFISDHPLILYCTLFSLLFAFMIGISTSNFGALVRFKIPLIPLYMSSVTIMLGHIRGVKLKRTERKSNLLR